MRKPKQIRSLADLSEDRANANKHTPRGASMMQSSIEECGFGDSMTADRDGTIISGHQRFDTLSDLQMMDPIVVQTDGTRPIIHQRIDLESGSERARKLAVYQNRVGELNLAWGVEELNALDIDLGKFWTDAERESLGLDGAPSPEIPEPEVQSRLTEEHICPKCGFRFADKK